MAKESTTGDTAKPCTRYVKEIYCVHCEGMVNGNGCGGWKDKDGTPMTCPVSGQTPAP